MSILFEMVYRKRIHGTVAAALGSIALVLADTLPIERNLNPLVAVLRSYWMQYHVTTILLSYSALTMAAGLAHFHLAASIFCSRTQGAGAQELAALVHGDEDRRDHAGHRESFSERCGLRNRGAAYWGWDPKETWALITLVGYIAILHGTIRRLVDAVRRCRRERGVLGSRPLHILRSELLSSSVCTATPELPQR
jgi:hypothetical protein